MKTLFKYITMMALPVLVLASCQSNDDDEFDNKAAINASSMVAETIVKGSVSSTTKTLELITPRPVEQEVKASFRSAPELLGRYNQAYYASAVLLPDTCYAWQEKDVVINQGSVKSTSATINFEKLGSLSRDSVYVLPVTAQTPELELLQSKSTYYFVFRAGALINVVPDMEKNNILINWKNTSMVRSMSQLTFEALIRARDFDRLISTVMGIEGYFLMRIGDAGVPSNQIQIATSNGNLTNGDLQLQTNKWYHLALTYDASTGTVQVYVNGRKMLEETKRLGNIDLTNGEFYIGRSYEDSRYLCGNICEVRIWNVVRTQEEIAANPYYVDPASEGLVDYWKLDDMSTNVVKDYTVYGNDGTAKSTLSWQNVSLPEK